MKISIFFFFILFLLFTLSTCGDNPTDPGQTGMVIKTDKTKYKFEEWIYISLKNYTDDDISYWSCSMGGESIEPSSIMYNDKGNWIEEDYVVVCPGGGSPGMFKAHSEKVDSTKFYPIKEHYKGYEPGTYKFKYEFRLNNEEVYYESNEFEVGDD